MLFQPRDQLPLCQRFRRRFSRFVVQVSGSSDSLLRCNAPAGKPLLVASSDNDQVACRIPPSGCLLRHVHMPVIFPPAFSTRLLHCDSVVICDNDSGIARPSDHAFRSSCRIFHIHRERIASFRSSAFSSVRVYSDLRRSLTQCTCGCQLRRRHTYGLAQKIPVPDPVSGLHTADSHRQTAHVIQQPAVAFEHRPQRVRQGEDQVHPRSQSGRRFSCCRYPRSVAFFPQDGQARLPHELVTYLTWGQTSRFIAVVFLHTQYPRAAGQHFCDSLNLDIAARAARIQEGCPALVGCEQALSAVGAENHHHFGSSAFNLRFSFV